MGESATAPAAPTSGRPSMPSGRGQRRLRNFLLDRHFQLKYSGYLVGVTLFLSVSLGVLLWRTGQELIVQSRSSVELGETVVEAGRNLLVESEKVNAVVRMSIVEAYADDPALLEVFQGEAKKRDGMLEQSQKQLEQNSAALRATSKMIEHQYLVFAIVIVSALLLLVLGIGLAGVVVTHKVAGPVYKMKRLLGELAKGHFRVVARLRKGDELQHFFDAFNAAAEQLSKRQEDEIEQIGSVITLLRDAEPGDAESMALAKERLQALRDAMRISLATRPPNA
ncbi:MAG TPA: HAMP domain-containing protein [Polyangiaceae bacterium]|nr:HAMP domain-containing protein [Polyangiaceae bacterium]